METKVFIPLEDGRIYLVKYTEGSRQSLGYYRLTLSGDVKAVLLKPFRSEETFRHVDNAREWLRNQTRYV